MTEKTLIVERQDIERCAKLAAAVADGGPDELREDAHRVFEDTSFWLLYGIPTDGRSIRMVPAGFRWPGYYVEMVAEFLLDLPGDVRSEFPGQVSLGYFCTEAASCRPKSRGIGIG
jgi:hypothetical protein